MRRAEQAADRRTADQGARRGRGSRRRPQRRARRPGPARPGGGRRRHGLPGDGSGRRNRLGRGADHRQARGRGRSAGRRRRHEALRVRRQEAHAPGRAGLARAPGSRGHADHDPEPAPARVRRAQHAAAGIVQDRRRRAASGDPGHLGPHQLPRRDQPRLRRRPQDHVGHGPRADGHGTSPTARTARSTRRRPRSPRRSSRTRRSRARAACSSTSRAATI